MMIGGDRVNILRQLYSSQDCDLVNCVLVVAISVILRYSKARLFCHGQLLKSLLIVELLERINTD